MSSTADSFINPLNAEFVADLYTRYLENPNSVDPSWVAFFGDLGEDGRAVAQALKGASWTPRPVGHSGNGGNGGVSPVLAAPAVAAVEGRLDASQVRAATLDSIRALMLIRSYRVRGHLIAKFDPLGLEGKTFHPELEPKSYGFAESDMDRPIFIDYVLGLETATMREILRVVRETYCGSIGVEFMHIQDPDEKAWIQRRIESIHNQTQFTLRGKRAIYERLVEAEGFENILHVKYPGTKRFGLDGAEATIPAIEQILKRGGQLGVREVVLGMPHRGRLNVLANVMHKPYVAIFSEFQGHASKPEDVQGSGDVKYHLGTSTDRVFDGNSVHLSLCANPSHLEAVNPVVVGKVRAKQTERGDRERRQTMGLLLHGDAAFAGQGLVAETLCLSELKGYTTGGTIHFIVNNQIGFTTSPSFSRSSPYPSDVAKMVQAPIFHVNGDDPEAVVHVARIATEFRQEFNRDVVIDMFCYRRHGHNEADEPAFTQPIMYKTIGGHPTTTQIYAAKLVREGVLQEEEAETQVADFTRRLEAEFAAAQTYKPNKADWFEGRWQGLVNMEGEDEFREEDTSVDLKTLRKIGAALGQPPENFSVNSKILRQLAAKRQMVETGEGIDWSTAEALAFGSLLVEGKPVRLSGQDSGRGTFSQRHAVLVDQENEERYVPLNHIRDEQARFEVLDSPLSEASVLGFEYGYSLAEPHSLVLWEAQFGDFANGAQVIIDQFISSGESKWLRLCGLVMLVPHGYEGQGPEHSSARPERYLQLCAENNMQVVNCTTPANYFHVLRRQLHRNFRKPLVVCTPKSLLRHKLAVSTLADMGPGSRFRRVLPETESLVADDKVRRVVLCTGKVYYDLLQARRAAKIDDIALVRVEQLYPWPRQTVVNQITRYANAEVVWCQEEPANMGAWSFVFPKLVCIHEELDRRQALPVYVGRAEAASPATGLHKNHVKEQTALVERALSSESLAGSRGAGNKKGKGN
ncbi:MAG: 2-oxoglutarate dehydrogenase E1 component [Rhodospirillales bacterium]|nr:2-oxoglutarate dehydrogenase E1 component [Rhodospirillales bacterium]